MATLTASQFRSLCDQVRDCIKSLKSCTNAEVANETRLLRTALDELCAATPSRRSAALIQRRCDAIEQANAVLARRRTGEIEDVECFALTDLGLAYLMQHGGAV